MEFARIPCSRPSIASCRVIPMIPALAVVCASEPRVLKLKRAFRDAVFTTTPWLAFRCGHAARVRKNTRSTSSRRSRFHSSSVMSSSQLKYAIAALLNNTSTRPYSRTARSISAWHSDGLVRWQGWREIIVPPWARTISAVASAATTFTSQPMTDAPSRANATAAALPMLPPVPVTTQTFPESLSDIKRSRQPGLGSDEVDQSADDRNGHIHTLAFRDSPAPLGALCFVGQLPRQHGAGRAGMVEQDLSDCSEPFCARPIALQFSGHGEPCDRLGARGDDTADCHVMCCWRDAARSVGDGVQVVAVAHRVDGRLRKTHLRPECSNDQLLAAGVLHCLDDTAVLPGGGEGTVDP